MRIPAELSDQQRDQLGRFSAEVQAFDFRETIRALDDGQLADKMEHIALTVAERAGGAETGLRELAICTSEALRRMAKPDK